MLYRLEALVLANELLTQNPVVNLSVQDVLQVAQDGDVEIITREIAKSLTSKSCGEMFDYER